MKKLLLMPLLAMALVAFASCSSSNDNDEEYQNPWSESNPTWEEVVDFLVNIGEIESTVLISDLVTLENVKFVYNTENVNDYISPIVDGEEFCRFFSDDLRYDSKFEYYKDALFRVYINIRNGENYLTLNGNSSLNEGDEISDMESSFDIHYSEDYIFSVSDISWSAKIKILSESSFGVHWTENGITESREISFVYEKAEECIKIIYNDAETGLFLKEENIYGNSYYLQFLPSSDMKVNGYLTKRLIRVSSFNLIFPTLTITYPRT